MSVLDGGDDGAAASHVEHMNGKGAGSGLICKPSRKVQRRSNASDHPNAGSSTPCLGLHCLHPAGSVRRHPRQGVARRWVIAARAFPLVVEKSAVLDFDRCPLARLQFDHASHEIGLKRLRRRHHRLCIGVLRKHSFLDLGFQRSWIAQYRMPVFRPQPAVIIGAAVTKVADDARLSPWLRRHWPARYGRQSAPDGRERRECDGSHRDQQCSAINHRLPSGRFGCSVPGGPRESLDTFRKANMDRQYVYNSGTGAVPWPAPSNSTRVTFLPSDLAFRPSRDSRQCAPGRHSCRAAGAAERSACPRGFPAIGRATSRDPCRDLHPSGPPTSLGYSNCRHGASGC